MTGWRNLWNLFSFSPCYLIKREIKISEIRRLSGKAETVIFVTLLSLTQRLLSEILLYVKDSVRVCVFEKRLRRLFDGSSKKKATIGGLIEITVHGVNIVSYCDI